MTILYFVGSIILVVAITMLMVFKKPKKISEFIKTEKGIVKGIVIVVVLIPLIAFLIEKAFAKPTTFNYAWAYAGMDYGKDRLPMCSPGDNNDRLASNVGFGLNILQTQDKKLDVNAKYTHHSCAYNDDYWGYDAIGLELLYRINFK